MDDGQKNTGKIMESSYLCSDNSYKFRTIIRIIYNKHEELNHWLSKEEILENLKLKDKFENYNEADLEEDLKTLEKLGNIIAIEDSRKIRTIEEFKKKKLKYSLSQLTINLEKSLDESEKSAKYQGSLEIWFLEEFKDNILSICSCEGLSGKDIYVLWKRLNCSFDFIDKESKMYLNKFYMYKNEKTLKTPEFLVFKDNFIRYIRGFIRGVHSCIEGIRSGFFEFEKSEENVQNFLNAVTDYERANILIDNDYDKEKRYSFNYNEYLKIRKWFISDASGENVCEKLVDECNEIIKKITKYAIKIMDADGNNIRRRDEYRKLVDMFGQCRSVGEAHKLSSIVFGVIRPRHIADLKARTTESIKSSIFDEEPVAVTVKPSNRYREKTASRVAALDKSDFKKKCISELIKKREQDRIIAESKIKDNKLVFSKLGTITSYERTIFLRWLSAALNKKDKNWVKNEYGRYYRAHKLSNKKNILVNCADGDFFMEDYELIFKE